MPCIPGPAGLTDKVPHEGGNIGGIISSLVPLLLLEEPLQFQERHVLFVMAVLVELLTNLWMSHGDGGCMWACGWVGVWLECGEGWVYAGVEKWECCCNWDSRCTQVNF